MSVRNRKDTVTVLALCVGLCMYALFMLCFKSYDVFYSENYLQRDLGFNFTVTQELLNGKLLYRDIFWPYGPIPILVYTLFAIVFGNSPVTYYSLSVLLSLVSLVLLYYVLRQHVSYWGTLLAFLIVFFYGSLRGINSLIYYNYELIFILLIAYLWRPIARRSMKRPFMLGLLLCML